MSCYFSELPNLNTLFSELGWEDTPEKRAVLDKAIREFLGFIPQESTCQQVKRELSKHRHEPNFFETLFEVLKDSLESEVIL